MAARSWWFPPEASRRVPTVDVRVRPQESGGFLQRRRVGFFPVDVRMAQGSFWISELACRGHLGGRTCISVPFRGSDVGPGRLSQIQSECNSGSRDKVLDPADFVTPGKENHNFIAILGVGCPFWGSDVGSGGSGRPSQNAKLDPLEKGLDPSDFVTPVVRVVS